MVRKEYDCNFIPAGGKLWWQVLVVNIAILAEWICSPERIDNPSLGGKSITSLL